MATPNSSPPTQRQDSKGPLVRVIQAMLNNNGITVTVDGDFGPKTKQAVMDFQRSRKLEPDGAVGPATWAALGADAARVGVTTATKAFIIARFNSYLNGPGLLKGSITVDGRTYSFNSGARTKLSVPKGVYLVHKYTPAKSGMTLNGVSFSFKIEDERHPGSDAMKDPRRKEIRTLLRIHPDGGGTGTEGCIGIVGNAATLRQFQAGMNAEMKRHGASLRLRVE
ncbi:peptidoglycan-binding protein [Archangium gephyra]|nr:peptidoglycan-binding protein [Archangium gephyra]